MNSSKIIIVSGLPRSGTSMMMQVLSAGGIEPLTDNIRKKDKDNPRGYYEYEPAKKTDEDPIWVQKADGKVVKMVYSLLYDLPHDHEYQVIFMDRDINEVLSSQKKMLKRLGREGAKVGDDKLKRLFKKDLSKFKLWISGKDNFSILFVNYKEMVESSLSQCKKINSFLGDILDVDSAATVVDPNLYRNRS